MEQSNPAATAEGTATSTATPAAASTPPDFQSLVPQEYKERPYLKSIKSTEDFFKQFDNAQTMLGKKTLFPAGDAPDEEWDKFFDTSGFRPKDAAGYDFQKPELPEGTELPEDYETRMRTMIHKAGLSPIQAKRLMGEYNTWVKDQIAGNTEKALARQQEIDQEFETLADKYFGKQGKAQAYDTAKKLMAAHLPEDLQAHLGELDNRALTMMAAFANGVAKKYISEDNMPSQGAAAGGTKSPAELDKEGIALMQTPEFKDQFNPAHEATKAKVRGIYEEITRLEALAKKK